MFNCYPYAISTVRDFRDPSHSMGFVVLRSPFSVVLFKGSSMYIWPAFAVWVHTLKHRLRAIGETCISLYSCPIWGVKSSRWAGEKTQLLQWFEGTEFETAISVFAVHACGDVFCLYFTIPMLRCLYAPTNGRVHSLLLSGPGCCWGIEKEFINCGIICNILYLLWKRMVPYGRVEV